MFLAPQPEWVGAGQSLKPRAQSLDPRASDHPRTSSGK